MPETTVHTTKLRIEVDTQDLHFISINDGNEDSLLRLMQPITHIATYIGQGCVLLIGKTDSDKLYLALNSEFPSGEFELFLDGILVQLRKIIKTNSKITLHTGEKAFQNSIPVGDTLLYLRRYTAQNWFLLNKEVTS